MKQIGTDIIARMLSDCLKCEPHAVKAIPGFSVNSVSYEMVGPLFDNDVGFLYSLQIRDMINLEYDPSKWEVSRT